ncbi:hypothetical protein P4C99_17545 [Pontiellaceae bacterium B1224]|nr:hypothetical protein [Pontiellaceae bacterium B1224]
MNLTQFQFQDAVTRGKNLLAELKKDYPELRLYPVFCRFGPGSGQCGLTTDPLVILEEFPEMLLVSPEVERLGRLLRQYRKAQKLALPTLSEIEKELNEAMRLCHAPHIPAFYCGDVNIEFRTGVLKYEPLRRLQQDHRLPPGLNTVGNIRVIAGPLEFLYRHA